MARIPPYVWDIALALGLFLLYLELKNMNLVSNEEQKLWEDYYRRQQQAAAGAQAGQQGSIFDSIGSFVGGVFDNIGKLGDLGGGSSGVRTM